MSEQKTKPHTGDVDTFIAQIQDPAKRADSTTLIAMMQDITGAPPVLWGSMVGFDQYHFRYASGHEGDAFLVGFAPRKAEFSIYLMGTYTPEETAIRDALLARLGKHRMGKGCLYVKRLSDIDLDVLRQLAANAVATLRAAYPQKNRAAGHLCHRSPGERPPAALLRAWGTSGQQTFLAHRLHGSLAIPVNWLSRWVTNAARKVPITAM